MSWFRYDVILAMVIYALVVAMVHLGKRFANAKKEKRVLVNSKNDLNEISVIIPFRNEIQNLPNLIHSIEKITSLPKEFIFVNDHSDDDFQHLIASAEIKCDVRIINLTNESGKKSAIDKGVRESFGKYILTWDADITVPVNYFETLLQVYWTDMVILPVEMRDSSFVGGFFAWDFQLQTKTAYSFYGWFRPITASGANLFFKKSSFLEVEKHRADENYLSGDDQFLLAAFRKSQKTVSCMENSDLVVITKPPQTVFQGLIQRSRWLGKTKAVEDNMANIFGLFVLVLQLSYYAFSATQLVMGNYGAAVVLVLIKGELDAFICTYRFQEQFNTFQVFLYELLFLIYIFALLFSSIFITQKWKGRPIKNPSNSDKYQK